MEIKFKRDTPFRKQFFVPDSFAHPAKMDAQLLIWIVEHYTETGEVILDPMAGSGTTMLACTLGRDVILVELEDKFCKMMEDNWGEVKMKPQLGYEMGKCQIIQGDARQLTSLCLNVKQNDTDCIISSPPFQEPEIRRSGQDKSRENYDYGSKLKMSSEHPDNISRLAERNYGDIEGLLVDKIVTSPPFGEAHNQKDLGVGDGDRSDLRAYSFLKSDNPSNIGNLPYGEIDKCIFSPPYAETVQQAGGNIKDDFKGFIGRSCIEVRKYSDDPNNLGNLPYGNIDSIITSPPYEASVSQGEGPGATTKYRKNNKASSQPSYSDAEDNIGNLKSQSYLEAMLQVYQQCHKVLKPQGLMILVTKNFIRNKAIVRLDEDTIKLCEQAGFSFLERHYRKLPSQSFWRVIYHQKFPDVEQINYEDIIIFVKGGK